MEVEHLPVFKITFKMVVNADRSATGRTACIKQVARLQREVLTDIRDNLVHLVEHIAGATFLYSLAIDVEMEMNGLYVAKLLHIHPCTYRRRTIEALGKFPCWPASRSLFCISRAVKSIPTVTAS